MLAGKRKRMLWAPIGGISLGREEQGAFHAKARDTSNWLDRVRGSARGSEQGLRLLLLLKLKIFKQD